MQTCSPSTPRKHLGGFTLIELLVVIAIVAVLAAILMPVIAKMQNTARKVQVANDMRNIRIGTNSYYADYHKLPTNDRQQMAVTNLGSDTVYGDPGGTYSNADLFDILRAIPDDNNPANACNPNKVVYWDGQFAKNPAKPVNGLTSQNVNDESGNQIRAGSFVDSWGHPYIIWLDANRDDDLTIAAGWFYSDAGTVHSLGQNAGMEFGSLGPDGKFGTKGNGRLKGSDDVVTWLQ